MIQSRQISDFKSINVPTNGSNTEYEVVHNLGKTLDNIMVKILDAITLEPIGILYTVSTVDVNNNIKLTMGTPYPIGNLIIQIR